MCFGTAPVRAAEPIPQLNGLTVSYDENASILPGLWAMPTGNGGNWTLKFYMNPADCTFYSGVAYEDTYYATRYTTAYGTVMTYVVAFAMDSDPEAGWGDWTNTHDATFLPFDLTYNPYDHRIYGFFSNAATDGVVYATVEYEHGSKSRIHPIKNMDDSWVAIAAAPDGTIYGIAADVDRTSGSPLVTGSALYKIDRLTGDASFIGATGQKPLLTGSATIDPRSGRMFWTVGPSASESYLCEVDLATGAATKLYDFTESRHVVGIYADVPAAEAKAPAAVTDATAACEGGSLEGAVSFTAPDACFDGTSAAGTTLTYRIFDDGVLLAEGTAAAGAAVTAPVTFATRGAHNLVLYTLNATGASPKTHVDAFAGYAVHKAPQNVTATAADNTVTITWDAVTEAADAGYLDAADVRYTVTETTTGTVVAQDIASTTATYTSNADGMVTLLFSVTADNHGNASVAAESNKVSIGAVNPPYAVGFDSESDLDNFTVIDANDDKKTWTFYVNRVRISYNTSLAMDDWLITPPIHLEAGKTYYASFAARSENDRYPEKVEAYWGSEPTAAGMTNLLVATTTLPQNFVELGEFITPAVTGNYYIGIHGVSEPNAYYLNVDDISVSEGLSVNAPDAPAGLTAVPDPDGEYKALVKLTAPDKTLAGAALGELTRIDVYRGDVLAHSFSNPAMGTELSFTDVMEQGGDITYTARTFNSDGEGKSASVTIFVGMPMAAAPEAVTITEDEPGMITLSWDKVALSAAGNPINPDKVKYNIYAIVFTKSFWGGVSEEEQLMLGGFEGNTHSFRAVAEGDQQIVRYSVSAVTDFGESGHTFTEKIPAGEPYADFSESWPDGEATTAIIAEAIYYGNWSAISGDWSEPKSQDGDSGYMAMNGYQAGYCGAITTGKISLVGIDHPQFTFYNYVYDDEASNFNTIAISVREPGGEWAEIWNKTVNETGDTKGWHEVNVPLIGYGGKVVQIRMLATIFDRSYTQVAIDNLSITTMLGTDLEVTAVAAPEYAKAGEPFNITVSYTNNGAAEVSGHTVDLFDADGNVVASVAADPVGSLSGATARLTAIMPATATDDEFYHVALTHDADERPENNESQAFAIRPVASSLPVPAALKAIDRTTGVELTWEAPAMDEAPAQPLTEDFESHTAWAHTSDSWFFIDVDKRPLGGFDTEIPAITPGQPASFFVFDTSDKFNGVTSFTAQSGQKYIAAAYCTGAANTDDWAVSPELSGEAQTISFYARSYAAAYPERIEVLYSTGSLNTVDFLPTACVVEAVAATWTRYEAQLPAGAMHFAIRSCSTDPFFVMVDDITFTPASTCGLTVDGYNVYRDGTKVNEAPVAATTFTDTVDDPEAHTWTVSAVYARGESGMSDEAKAEESGISDALAGAIRIEARSGRIIVTGAEGHNLTISAADGVLLYNATATARTEVEAATGIYIVKAGPKVAKVAVR